MPDTSEKLNTEQIQDKVQADKVKKDEKAKPKKAKLKKDLAGKLLPSSRTRTFLARGLPGRDGDGPCEVTGKKSVLLPNGDVALKGDTIDPIVEGMTVARYMHLTKKRYITPGGEKVETKLIEAAEKRKAPGCGKEKK